MPGLPTRDPFEKMLTDYNIYDEHVDVVSALEWLCTVTQQMPATVRHFERYPRVKVSDGRVFTPDFTVLLTNGTAIVGEIAQFAIADGSVDGLCSQLANYAALTQVPDASGSLVTVTDSDVLFIVPDRLGQKAIKRIIRQRYQEPSHPYKPAKPPAIATYSRDSERYTLSRLGHPENGTLPATSTPMTLGFLLDEGLSPPVNNFKNNKADRRFNNDPIDPLYLATHFWTATWPTLFPGRTDDINVDVAETADLLRRQFGYAAGVRRSRFPQLIRMQPSSLSSLPSI